VRIGLKSLNVVTGANGSGKSSLYRALRLLADIAQGRIIQSLAAEGGLHSTLWAGPESFARSVKRGERPSKAPCAKRGLMRSRYLSVPSDSSAAFKGRSSPCCRISFSKNT